MPVSDLTKTATEIAARLSPSELKALTALFQQPNGAEIFADAFADAVKEYLKKWQELPQPGEQMPDEQREQWEALQAKYRETGRAPKGRRKKTTA